MMSQADLNEIQGGSGFVGILAAAAGAISFIIGFFDGLTRPYKCR